MTPTVNGVVGLTVKETSGTAADILDLQSSAGANLVTVGATGTLTVSALSSAGVVHNNANTTISNTPSEIST